jgi:hypothetical protein
LPGEIPDSICVSVLKENLIIVRHGKHYGIDYWTWQGIFSDYGKKNGSFMYRKIHLEMVRKKIDKIRTREVPP